MGENISLAFSLSVKENEISSQQIDELPPNGPVSRLFWSLSNHKDA